MKRYLNKDIVLKLFYNRKCRLSKWNRLTEILLRMAVFDRPYDANKGTLGSLLCICGCFGMAGAAIMAGKAALRCGLGLLKTALPKSIYPIAAGAIFESVFFRWKKHLTVNQ
jgi:NAD(P)H-hydrate repair Nnr-like enzyme with NAD(P)H-hydrate dehydratase domain